MSTPPPVRDSASELSNARAAIEVATSPSFEYDPARELVQTPGRNLLKAEVNLDVGRPVALAVVGSDRAPVIDATNAEARFYGSPTDRARPDIGRWRSAGCAKGIAQTPNTTRQPAAASCRCPSAA